MGEVFHCYSFVLWPPPTRCSIPIKISYVGERSARQQLLPLQTTEEYYRYVCVCVSASVHKGLSCFNMQKKMSSLWLHWLITSDLAACVNVCDWTAAVFLHCQFLYERNDNCRSVSVCVCTCILHPSLRLRSHRYGEDLLGLSLYCHCFIFFLSHWSNFILCPPPVPSLANRQC